MRAQRVRVACRQIIPEMLVSVPLRPVRMQAVEGDELPGAYRWWQKPQLRGQAARPEDEIDPLKPTWLRTAELGGKGAPAELIRLLGEEHH
jgi:hypothetical protein